MDFYKFGLPLLILFVGCCCGDLLPPDISGIIGRNITFPTTLPVSPSGIASVTWSFKSPTKTQPSPVYTRLNNIEKIGDGYVGRVRFNITTFELRLGPLTALDGGIYTLSVVTVDVDTLTAETTLQVLDAVADVKIMSNVSEAVEINSTVVLTCNAKGSSLSYTWKNGTAPVTVDGQHVTIQGNQLTISSVLRDDLRGPIYCTVNNKLETGTSPAFNLTVNYGPENVVMTRVPMDTDMKKGSNLTLSCSAQSSPPATISWFLNGGVLPEKSDTLFLSSLKEEHSGNYTCLAYNSKTMRYTASQVATVTVLEAISGTSITGPMTLLIAGNSTANLTCQSQQGKVDSVVWLKDDKPLVTTPVVLLSTDQRTVSITTVQKEDAGKYRCQLKNRVSITEGNYTMVVNYGPENVKIEGPKQVEIVDRAVVIKCLAASVPTPTYTWKLNGTLLSEQTFQLNFSQLDYMKSGLYTCEVLNRITGLNQTASHSLQVKGEGELHDQLSDGAIAAIVITVLVIVAVIIAVIIHKKRKVSDIPSPY